jgi:hypothetical protein
MTDGASEDVTHRARVADSDERIAPQTHVVLVSAWNGSAGVDAVTCLAHGEGDSDDALALDAQTEPSRTLYRHARVSTSERDRIAQVISTVSSPCRR